VRCRLSIKGVPVRHFSKGRELGQASRGTWDGRDPGTLLTGSPRLYCTMPQSRNASRAFSAHWAQGCLTAVRRPMVTLPRPSPPELPLKVFLSSPARIPPVLLSFPPLPAAPLDPPRRRPPNLAACVCVCASHHNSIHPTNAAPRCEPDPILAHRPVISFSTASAQRTGPLSLICTVPCERVPFCWPRRHPSTRYLIPRLPRRPHHIQRQPDTRHRLAGRPPRYGMWPS